MNRRRKRKKKQPPQPFRENTNGCIYLGLKKREDEWIDRPLSNFVLRVIEHVEMPGGPVLVVDVLIKGESRGQRSLTNDDLLSHTALLKALKVTDAAWLGTAEHFQRLRIHLGKQPCLKYKGTTVLGRHTVRELDQERIGEGAAEVVDVMKDFDYIVLPTVTLGAKDLGEPPIKYVDGRDNEMAKAIQRMASARRQVSRR